MNELHSGALYNCSDPALLSQQELCLELLYDFNATRPSQKKQRSELLKKMLAECGENCYIEPPFYCNWGGHYVHFGSNIYANFGLTCVDDTHIYVGDSTMFGPHVTLATASHPLLPALRAKTYQYNLPIHIGKNCWLGAGVIVLAGVTIGDNSVIGAGSVVTKDIPANCLAMGVPCRVVRPFDERDRETYYKDKTIHWDEIKLDD